MSYLYKECGRIVGLVVAGKGSVKSLCLSTKNKAKTKVYAIVFNVLQSKYIIQYLHWTIHSVYSIQYTSCVVHSVYSVI